MIVWGGFNGDSLNTGGRYDPSIDTWTPTSTGANVPTPRARHIAVWTGAKMIVWGGYYRGDTNTGGRYDPFTDTWIPTSTGVNVPPPSEGNTAVWTATEMIVWGGGLNTVGRYDPYTDTWIPPSTKPRSPIGLANHAAVWTGTEMIVWGGYYSGERYDPSTDNWTPTSTGVGVPQARRSPTAVWTGTEMIVWGGAIDSSPPSKLNTGGRYDPSTDSWTQTSTGANVPIPREGHSAVWTGTEMIIWGGFVESCSLDCCFPLCVEPDMCWFCNAYPLSTGGRYDPSTDTWTSTSTGANVPTPRENHTAIWTGTEMIVWGGGPSDPLNTGGRYDPSTDTWTPTPTGANLPAGRQDHTAIWSGSEMIVWGGNDCYVDCCDVDCADFCSFCNAGSLISGGRYDPSTDTWTPTSTGAAVPTPREGHTAVWTGKEMIIWGGFGSDLLNTGGRYDPSINTWTPTSTGANVPTPREGHSAVWNGTEMIVWGGSNGLNTGGLYCACPNGTLYYHDADGDGYGDPAVVGTSCDGMVPGGYAANPGDCNDANASLHPGAPELCNGIDDDCNGVIDDGFDGDHDGFSACAGDCDDGNAAIHPGAVELCDGRDNDCDGIVDGFTTVCGVGACFRTGSCIAGVDSCAPASPSTEICDGIDNDCDGSVDNVPLPIGSPSVTIDFPSGVPALRWTPLPDATRYDVVAGDIVALLSSGGDFTSAILGCLADDSAANALDLSDAPAVGTGFFYLVRGENCGGPGTYDSGDPAQVGSCNAAINASPLSCPQCGDGICSVYENYDTCFDDCWY
jgi:N-acetylneuraminic acid mutarotase